MINYLVFHFCSTARLRQSQATIFLLEKIKRNSSRPVFDKRKKYWNQYYFVSALPTEKRRIWKDGIR